jgi:hypothetical protein
MAICAGSSRYLVAGAARRTETSGKRYRVLEVFERSPGRT